MTRVPNDPWKLPAPWTAQHAAHRALENAHAFSTSSHRSFSHQSIFKKTERTPESCVRHHN